MVQALNDHLYQGVLTIFDYSPTGEWCSHALKNALLEGVCTISYCITDSPMVPESLNDHLYEGVLTISPYPRPSLPITQ